MPSYAPTVVPLFVKGLYMRVLTTSGWLCAAVMSVAIFGCNTKSGSGKATRPDAQEHHEKDGHKHAAGEHAETGPHGGHLIELGKEDYHAELTHDEAAHVVTIYILDGKAKDSVPIPAPEVTVNVAAGGAPKQFKLAAAPQAGESPMASCFRLKSEGLCEALDAPNANGRLAVTINGKQFIGNIEHDHKEHAEGSEGGHQQK